MYCKKCGNYIPNGINKCAHCGWIVGSEVIIDDEKEEILEEPKLEAAQKAKFLVDIFALVVIASFLIYSLFFNYIEFNQKSILASAIFVGTEPNFDVIGYKPYELFAHLKTIDTFNFIYIYKFVFLFASYILFILLIIRTIAQIKGIKRLNYSSTLKLSFFLFGIILASRISTLNNSLYPVLIGTGLMSLLGISYVVISYKNNELSSKALGFSIVTFIFMFAVVFFANTNNFALSGREFAFYDYLYYLYYYSENFSVNTVPAFTSVIYDICLIYLMVLAYVLLKTKNNRKLSTLPIIGIGFSVFLIGLIIYNIIAVKDLEVQKVEVYVTFYIFSGLLIITNIFGFVTNKINVYDFNSTKIYNL